MKKKISMILLSVFVLLVCSACNGTITRDIRHAGFAVGGKFTCDGFYPADKEDTFYQKIQYFTGSHLINSDGKIYELSLGQPYQNKQNCKEANTDLRVKAIMNDSIIKATDGRYYYLTSQNQVAAYTEVPKTDNTYAIYDLLLRDQDVVKVVTADSSTGTYYVLKVDGNVYGNVISSQDRNSPPKLISTQIVFDQTDYEGRIIDFNYAGDSLATFVRTTDKVFRYRMRNAEECTKFADITCEFDMKEDPIFQQYKDNIITYNGSMLITTYQQMFNVAS